MQPIARIRISRFGLGRTFDLTTPEGIADLVRAGRAALGDNASVTALGANGNELDLDEEDQR